MKTLAKKAKRRTRPTPFSGQYLRREPATRIVRPREYLTPKEVERLIAAAKKRTRRYGLRDATMILVAFRHGLRVSRALLAHVGSDRFLARHDARAAR